MQENKPMLIVGLGNPGMEYLRTRHNVGFMAVMQLAGVGAKWHDEHNARVCKAVLNGQRVIYALPQTYMNLSGVAVQALMAFYKIPLENLIVIHDDMDLAVGTLREKIGGGSAGHNGIRSVDSTVGTEYRRFRIGIGHPRDYDLPMDPADWVLGRFDEEQLRKVMAAISGLHPLD